MPIGKCLVRDIEGNVYAVNVDYGHLTQDAPGFLAHMESKMLVGRYEW